MVERVAFLNLVSAAVLTVAVVAGGRAWGAAAGLWFVAFVVVSVDVASADRGGAGAKRVLTLSAAAGLPSMLILAVLVARRYAPVHTREVAVAGAGVGVGALVAAAVAVLVVGTTLSRWRRGPPPAWAQRPRSRRRRIAIVLTIPLVAAPLGADVLVEARLLTKLRGCRFPVATGMARGDRQLQTELADACAVSAGAPARRVRTANVEVVVYGRGEAPGPALVDQVASVVTHYEGILGRIGFSRILVVPVGLAGDVRGKAGPGYVLVDSAEMAKPTDCDAFRGSAGVEGRCGTWVIAHEIGHQWFRWSAYRRPGEFWAVVGEGTSDYLAFDWWRSRHGVADADRLAVELLDGRMRLARGFAAAHPPDDPPRLMSDAEQRAVVYGRASAVWVAVERAVGVAGAHRALRAVYEVGRSNPLTIDSVLAAVEAVEPEAADVLRQWWTEPGFVPRLQ